MRIIYSNPEQLQKISYCKKPKKISPFILAVLKTVWYGFSETGFNFKSKIIFSCQQTSNRVRKYLIIDSYSYNLNRTALCAAVSPPDDRPFFKKVQISIFDLETINLVQSLCLMLLWVQGSKSQYLEAFVYILKQYFILSFKKILIRGGHQD